jgi:hypothetical protein
VIGEPLYPYHGKPYHDAMQAAITEYENWLQLPNLFNGIYVYSRKQLDAEEQL